MKRVFSAAIFLLFCSSLFSQKIDRKALVLRHNIVLTKVDSLSPITLGNGRFAFRVDATGLQTFPSYQQGASLYIGSGWGQNIFSDKVNYKEASDLQNSHFLQFGNLGFEIVKGNGTQATLSDIKNIYQELNLWTGKLRSHFTVEGIPVEVATYSSGSDDAIGVKVRSQLIKDGRLKIKLLFSYPKSERVNEGINYVDDDNYQSSVIMSHNTGAVVMHRLDTAKYYVGLKWEGGGFIEQKKSNYFLITPDDTTDLFDLTARFTPKKDFGFLPTFIDIRTSSENQWKNFWTKCDAIDFSASTNKRSFELERRIVLSQYLRRTLDANSYAKGNRIEVR
jgi:hypothetical protein